MAEVQCPSPFSAVGSLNANIQIEYVPYAGDRSIFWNSSDKGPAIVLSNEDLTVTASFSGDNSVRATISKSSGKWYWEERVDARSNNQIVGAGTSAASLNSLCGWDIHGYGYNNTAGKKYHNGSWVDYGDSWTHIDDIIGVALDLDNGKIWFSKNGVWQESGDPAAGTNEAYSGLSGTFFPMTSVHGAGDTLTAKFITTDFTYSPPSGFDTIDPGSIAPFASENSLSSLGPECLWVDTESPFSSINSLSAMVQPQISGSALSANGSLLAVPTLAISARAFSATAGFTCDHCFNYAQMAGICPTPTSDIDAVFRWARINASPPVPTASLIVGKRIQGNSPIPNFTCSAYFGRNPSLIANSPCPTCSIRVGIALNVAGISVPTCTMVADTHHLATIYGQIPCPLITCNANTENIAALLGLVPCPRGLFDATIGNVANIWARVPCPSGNIIALNGQIVTLAGSVPVPGDLVRFYASLKNEGIILVGTVPTPDMISSVRCLTSLILRYIRGKIR